MYVIYGEMALGTWPTVSVFFTTFTACLSRGLFGTLSQQSSSEVLTEVNEFLIQLEEERNETGCDLDDSVESEEDSDENERDEEDDVDVEIV